MPPDGLNLAAFYPLQECSMPYSFLQHGPNGIPLLGICILTFLSWRLPEKIAGNRFLQAMDILLFILGISSIAYTTNFFNEIAQRMGNLLPRRSWPVSLSSSLYGNTPERMAGLPLSLVALAFLLYAYFGPLHAGFMAHQGILSAAYEIHVHQPRRDFGLLFLRSVMSFLSMHIFGFLEKLGGGKFLPTWRWLW